MGAGRDLFGVRRDGSRFPVETGLNPIETDEGLFVPSSIVDITARKALESALIPADQRLEHRVRDLTADLARQTAGIKRANEALECSNLELQRFACIISLDLQSPLRSISGFLQLLKLEYEDRLDEQADDRIRRAIQATQQMHALIRDLLEYSPVDSEPSPFQQVRFQEVVDNVLELLDSAIRSSIAERKRRRSPCLPNATGASGCLPC